MVKKRKIKKKTTKKKKDKTIFEKYIRDYTPPPSYLFDSIQDNKVLVHIKLINWSYLNFDIIVPESTNLFVIKQKIMEHHGRSICEIVLWKDHVNTKYQLSDLNQTLRQIFEFDESYKTMKEGAEYQYECTMYYDFKPLQSDCPLLMSSPRILYNEK